MTMFARKYGEKIVQTARIRLLGIGKYAFETSLFGNKPFELNMNMPLFDSENEAYEWIKKTNNWEQL